MTLTATPNATSTFDGWSGAGCSGTGTCQVTMSQARSVSATFTAFPHLGSQPDALIAKSKAGLFACVVAPSKIFDLVHPGDIGGTYGGNPLSCAAGLAVLKVFKEERLVDRAGTIAARIRGVLEDLTTRLDWVGEVRGLGTMLAVELVEEGVGKLPAPGRAQAVVEAARANGLLLIKAGVFNNVVRFLPPLTITDDDLDNAESGIRASFAS